MICTTADCPQPATSYVSCEGEGAYPYCTKCAEVLVRGGETDHGPVKSEIEQQQEKLVLRIMESVVRVLAAYEVEESEDGFPFSFELREAHRELLSLFEEFEKLEKAANDDTQA